MKNYLLIILNIILCIFWFLVWQEAFQNGQGKLSKNAIVHVWKGGWENTTTEVVLKAKNNYSLLQIINDLYTYRLQLLVIEYCFQVLGI